MLVWLCFNFLNWQEGQAIMINNELHEEIAKLSVSDKLELFTTLSNYLQGTLLQKLEVRIDDTRESRHRKPIAEITYPDGSTQHIDILASIENNILSLGHPAILTAICRWREMVAYENLVLDDVYTKEENIDYPTKNKTDKEQYRYKHEYLKLFIEDEKEYRSQVKKHLEKIVTILKRKEHISIEQAYALRLEADGIDFNDKESILYKTWELLADPEIKKCRTENNKREKIQERLKTFPVSTKGYSVTRIIDFLKSEKGEFYLRTKKRVNWLIFFNAFFSWKFAIEPVTLTNYRSRAKNQDSSSKQTPQDIAVFWPYLLKTYDISTIWNGLSLPVVNATLATETQNESEIAENKK